MEKKLRSDGKALCLHAARDSLACSRVQAATSHVEKLPKALQTEQALREDPTVAACSRFYPGTEGRMQMESNLPCGFCGPGVLQAARAEAEARLREDRDQVGSFLCWR